MWHITVSGRAKTRQQLQLSLSTCQAPKSFREDDPTWLAAHKSEQQRSRWSLVTAQRRVISYPRGIICQMNGNISDFHLLCAYFSCKGELTFLSCKLADFILCYFWGLGSRADSPSHISENFNESGAGCSCEWRFWQVSTESGWSGVEQECMRAAQGPNPHLFPRKWAVQQPGYSGKSSNALATKMGLEGATLCHPGPPSCRGDCL